jgi:hypothetical protein
MALGTCSPETRAFDKSDVTVTLIHAPMSRRSLRAFLSGGLAETTLYRIFDRVWRAPSDSTA